MTAIVGLGAVTGYGWGLDALQDGLRSHTSCAVVEDVDGAKVMGAVIPDPPDGPCAFDERYQRAIDAAVDEALADATSRGWEPGRNVAVLFCTGIADIKTLRDKLFLTTDRVRPSTFTRMLHTAPGSLLAQRHGWTGPNLVINAACSSGNVALQLADAWLTTGVVSDVVLAGAELLLINEIVTGFRRMRVLLGEHHDITDCRPFQDGSRGFFLGEAAVATVLTAEADGARATYLGGATTHDAFHLAAPEPDGRELERCMLEALQAANVAAGDIGLVKTHGSGTPANDRIEAMLFDKYFPASTSLCSYKPCVGHCMGMSSMAELAAVLASYEIGELPTRVTATHAAHPQLADGEPMPDGLALCVSVGLGGTNAAAVLDVVGSRGARRR